MRYSIHQLDATTWELRSPDGTSLGTFSDNAGRTGYDLALGALGAIITAELAAAPAPNGTDGLLAEGWTSDQGICFSRKLAGGRDFEHCTWSWRDPAACLVPLMFQTENEGGHWGAELAGFFTELSQSGGTVHAAGRFYDSEVGAQARDTLLDGRRFGVSVDPTEAVEAEYAFECVQWDDDGFCEAGEESIVFSAYEIGGMTMTPFPAFEEASIVLEASPAQASTRPTPVRAALSIPTAPPAEWMRLAEPRPGVEFLPGVVGDDILVEQVDSEGNVQALAVPLTIRDDGLVYGHLTYWGQCHTGNPWGRGMCASAQPSANGYADFHCSSVQCADGTQVPTGRLVVGCEHSDAFDVVGVRDHMAQAGMGWASVHVVDGEFGPWMCGVLEPDLTEAQVRVLRSLSLSGEWVGELGGVLAVNASGLPVQRARLAASGFVRTGFEQFTVPQVALRASFKGGQTTKLVGGNVVRACPECAKRAARQTAGTAPTEAQLALILRELATLNRRTRHLIAPEAEAMLDRLTVRAG